MRRGVMLLVVLLPVLLGACPKGPAPRPEAAVSPRRGAPEVSRRGAPAGLALFDTLFEVSLEQEGRQVPIVGHEASLHRGPFAILLRVHDPSRGILMNVSFDPMLYQRARRGEALEAYFAPGTGMAEEAVVTKKELFIADHNAHHYLLASPEMKTNRYHEVHKLADGFFRCRRAVEQLYLVPDQSSVDLAEVKQDAIYLVFYLGFFKEEQWGERQRDYLQIRFVD